MISLALHLIALFAAVSLMTALLVGAAVRLADARVSSLDQAARARLMLALLAAPPFVATLVVAGVSFPHQWLGMVDHCLDHPGHLHLCFVHGAPPPGPVIGMLASIGALYLLVRLARPIVNAVRGGWAVRRLLGVARRQGDVWVLPNDAPMAFTVGLARPTVVVSDAVFGRASEWTVVLEHERAHVAGRHPLARWLAELLTAFHPPRLGASLARQLREAQELSADERAAAAVGSRIAVAEALLDWMRWNHAARDAVGFHSGPLEVRVRRLLDPAPSRPGPSSRGLVCAAAFVATPLGLAAPSRHHAVETALGLLPS